MNGSYRMERRKSLTERLGLKRIGCCGSTWGLGPAHISVRDDEEEEGAEREEVQIVLPNVGPSNPDIRSTPVCSGQTPGRSGMNLAAALAAERQFRDAQETERVGYMSPRTNPEVHFPTGLHLGIDNNDDVIARRSTPGTPYRVSLMRLLEETEACDEREEKENAVGSDSVCCVCMARIKGAAFIPCGHTFCRVCSRELWLNRGSCPLCNRSVVEVLDIF